MPTGPGAPKEHVILDESIKAQGHAFYRIGAFKVSPDNKLAAYAEETKDNEIYKVYVIDADNGTPVGNPLKGVSPYVEWAGNDTLVYITTNEFGREDKVWSHKLLSKQSSDQCLYHEKDDMFYLDLKASESKQYLFVESHADDGQTQFILYLDVNKKEYGLMTLTPRVHWIYTSASHSGNYFFIQRRSEELYNSELVSCPVDNPSKTKVLIPNRERVRIDDFQLFSAHIAVYESENGLQKATVYRLPPTGEAIEPLQDGRAVHFVDPLYTVYSQESEFSSSILRFYYSSMITPPSIYDYDMNSGISVLKNQQQVINGFKSSDYLAERRWAVSSDGTKVPISILYKKNLVKFDGSDPLLLYGFGAYGFTLYPLFDASIFSLVNRGFIYAMAHVRGDGEMGTKWHEDGMLLKKKNTFYDFIACAEYLIKNNYCSKETLCMYGRDYGGGMLIGAVLNMRPDLFKAAATDVPFVDVLTTMLDPKIPSTLDFEEFGDPRKEEYYYYIKSYSPVDNVRAQNYPNILVTADLYGTQVPYYESAKFVAKLRATKTDANVLLFKCDLGVTQESFQPEKLDAIAYAFLMKALDLAPPVSN